MRLTDSQIELIRTRPQQSRLYLSIFQPRTVMQCRINDSTITKGARTITYNSVTLGTYLNVQPGMTLLIGTSLGGKEIGRIRIRSATSTTFTVSENSNINWQDALYLTVLRYWEVWPVFPRIIHDPSNIENVIFYKDYDIPYTNQNSILGAFVNAGPHRAALLDGGQAQLWYSSTGTYHVVPGVTLHYEWEFEGGTPTGSTSADPGYISYSQAGDYVTRLTVSGSNGSIDTTYRYVSIRNPFSSSPTGTPIQRWTLSDMTGSRIEGGITAKITVYDNIQIDDNAVVVIFSDDWYGSTHQSLGGNYPNSSSIFFVGYVSKDTIQYDYQKSLVQFEVYSITGLMKDAVGFSVSTQSDANPDTWYKILDLDTTIAMYHYLRWHTTILSVSDFQFVGQSQKIQYFDSDRSSMFDSIDNLLKNTLVGSLCADSQGKIWAEVDPMAYTNPTGTFTPVMSLSKRDWYGEPEIAERIQDEVSYIEYGGIAYSGIVTGTFAPLMACAPGGAPSFRGKADSAQQGLAILGQSQLNSIVGNVFANRNTKYNTIRLNITEKLRNLDIAPQETVGIHIDAQDTNENRNINILGIPSEIVWSYNPDTGLLTPQIVFTNLVSGMVGDTIDVPTIQDSGGFSVPGLKLPPLPIFQFAQPSGTPTGSSSGMAYIDCNSNAGTNASVSFSRGAWAGAGADTSGLWMTVLYTGLYLVTGIITVNVGTLATDPGVSFIAKHTGVSSWGTVYKHAERPSIGTLSPQPYVAQYFAELTAIVYLLESEAIGIGMDTSVGGNSQNRRLQITLLALG